ncbi:hypothetical protein EXIGLDRAFT_729694 [Exidia glandulosa HHB12029]|uniref:Uncharacterized protein n=1 Tax=Exidia glandulosa HHB12029 TaxID=1314781 RepID=A0A165CHI3_EXIGL|nr:hypothetical protein EXIGLDRAFT_729694 [Exidia glandulosa HHB12029]
MHNIGAPRQSYVCAGFRAASLWRMQGTSKGAIQESESAAFFSGFPAHHSLFESERERQDPTDLHTVTVLALSALGVL